MFLTQNFGGKRQLCPFCWLQGAGSADQHRNFRDGWRGFQAVQNLETAHPGHAQIENDGIRAQFKSLLYSLRPAACLSDADIEVPKLLPNEIAVAGIVVNDEDARCSPLQHERSQARYESGVVDRFYQII